MAYSKAVARLGKLAIDPYSNKISLPLLFDEVFLVDCNVMQSAIPLVTSHSLTFKVSGSTPYVSKSIKS